jgi:uncharacterized protein YjbJ (UPF0337 family)
MTNSDIIKGKMKQAEGKVEQKFGEIVDSPKHEVKGAVKQAVGTVQEGYGKARESARKHVDNRNKAR